jgi:pimeloyl-ACP methyl ester carboxylesterase
MLQLRGESGPVVLLLSGGGEAVEGFYPGLAEGLMADPGCRVLMYDRPGTAASGTVGDLSTASDSIHDVLADLGVGAVVVIGQSLGGAVAMLLAHDHPEDVGGLVLLDPTPVNDVGLARKIERTSSATATLSVIPGLRGALRRLLRASARRSVRQHHMSPQARAATLKMAEVDLVQLSKSAAGLESLARGFDESQLPAVPAAVVTADRKSSSSLRSAHQRLAVALDTPLLSWKGAVHEVHLSHELEVLEVARSVVRAHAAW